MERLEDPIASGNASPMIGIRRALADDRRALRDAVDMVPEHRRDQCPAEGRWSVAEVLEHLAIVEERSLGVLAKLAAAAPVSSTGQPMSPAALERTVLRDRARRFAAPDAIQPTGTVTAEEAWARLERSRAALDAALAAAGDRDFTKVTRAHPALGPLDGYQWIAAIGGHEERHAAQILEIARMFGGL